MKETGCPTLGASLFLRLGWDGIQSGTHAYPKTAAPLRPSFCVVRPAGRTHLGVQVPYTPGKGKC